MKMIEGRANNAWFDYQYTGGPTFERIFKDGFKAGAESEHDMLTKWNDPKDKLPPDDREVLCMIDCCYNTYLILKHNDLGWWMLASNGGRCVCAFEVIGWREIHDNV